LAGGFLTGKYRLDGPAPTSARARRIRERYFSDRNFSLLAGMERIGGSYGQGIPQVALAWLLTSPTVTAPIVGANSVSQLQTSLAAVSLRLTKDEMQTLNDLSDWQDV
jgi:aryl-alcohol dehydrogenase-like predicted oxidoreductase